MKGLIIGKFVDGSCLQNKGINYETYLLVVDGVRIMVGMTWEQQKLLYEMIEKAVQEKLPIVFPDNVYPVLQVGQSSTGPTFTIPGLFWIDEQRNIYEAWMQMEICRKGSWIVPGLYVKGFACPDGFSSGDTSMFCAENRYKSII